MTPTPRDRYTAKRAYPHLFRYYQLKIGCPLRREVVTKWGDVEVPVIWAFICYN